MRRLPIVLALAAVIAALAALPASGYQFLSQFTGGGEVEPDRWPASLLPLNVIVDGGDPDITAEVADAKAAWNGVTTAKDVFGTVTRSATDFTGANLGTAWGNLTGDGSYEVVLDSDGSAMTALGFAPGSINGFGSKHEIIRDGHAAIDDMFLLINGTGNPPFDRRSTEVHELGHTLGLAHSTVGWPLGKDGALSPVLTSQAPTMHPFATDENRRTLEADDRAALSELYPDPSFTTTTGTISGKVTRCGSGEPVLGANVRAISTASPAVQVSRITGFDGKTDGSYEINGLPPGDYFVVVEPLSGDGEFFGRLALFTDEINTDFLQENFSANEADCAHDTDPNDREPVPVGAAAESPVDFKVDNPGLALVIDVTGSMGPEQASIKTGLETMISTLEQQGGHFPRTAIVTFKDEAKIETVSDDPARLRQVIGGLTTQSTLDCPEASNAALMTAGRLLGSGGKAVLATDAESLPSGPSRAAVDALYASKGVRLSTLLSGSCAPISGRPARAAAPAATSFAGGDAPDVNFVPDQLGNESAIQTFSEESLFSGGLFFLQPDLETGGATAAERYSNTLANLAVAAVTPAVAAVSPSALPQGTTVTVELTGSGTGFRPGSTVTVGAAGVTAGPAKVLSPTRILVALTAAASVAPDFYDVSVSTDRGDGTIETAKGVGAVQVTGPPAGPTVLSVTPATLAAGTIQDVTISGGATHFSGASQVAFAGTGVTAAVLSAESPTSLTARVTVAPSAAVGLRSVSVTSGGETAAETVPGPLLVTAAPPPLPRLTQASPASGVRGTTVDVALTGVATSFDAGSRGSVGGSGVQVLSTTVSSPTSAVARLRIASDAPLGFRDLKVRTGAQDAVLLNGFEVKPAAAAATATPAPTASPQPTPAPQPTFCADRARPRASFGRAGAKRGKLTMRGRASDAGCTADISVAGRVARVELAISRTAGRRCRFASARGRLGKARACSRPVWLKAKGTTRWSLAVKLPRGRYTLLLRVRDGVGNLSARPVKRSVRVR
jgi:hypothetical protein